MTLKASSNASTAIASVCCLIIGGVIGFYGQTMVQGKQAATTTAPAGRGGGAGMGGGFGGGGFGGAPSPGGDLARMVRNLDTIQKVQGAGLTPDQGTALSAVLNRIKGASTISDTDAKADADAIEQILTPAQKDALTAIAPPRGARGGMGGGMRGGGGMGGGGFGGPQNPGQPFASERNQAALDDLIAQAGKK